MEVGLSLFQEPTERISGLDIHLAFLSDQESMELLSCVDSQLWLGELARRVQHYGWKYDYRKRIVEPDAFLGDLPPHFELLATKIAELGYMSHAPDQVIVNEYLPGQGVAAHIDCEPCFGPEIATLSLGDEYPMVFTHNPTGRRREFWLPVGSLCVMSGEARYEWSHQIEKRKSDRVTGARKLRHRRVSVTFRKVIVSN